MFGTACASNHTDLKGGCPRGPLPTIGQKTIRLPKCSVRAGAGQGAADDRSGRAAILSIPEENWGALGASRLAASGLLSVNVLLRANFVNQSTLPKVRELYGAVEGMSRAVLCTLARMWEWSGYGLVCGTSPCSLIG